MNSTKLIALLELDNWQLSRIKGSHHIFKHLTKKPILLFRILKKICLKARLKASWNGHNLRKLRN